MCIANDCVFVDLSSKGNSSIGRLSTGHGGVTSQVSGCLRMCRAADTVTDWRQKLHGRSTAAVQQSDGQTRTAEH